MISRTILILSAVTLLGGCSLVSNFWQGGDADDKTSGADTAPAASTAAVNDDDYYEVHQDGRIHVFDDAQIYLSFLSHGETAYRIARIGEGPSGETIVFGLTDADKKKREGIASVMMYDGRLEGRSADFYAEVIHDGRFYVFSEWADLQAFRSVWEAPYRFTDIGSGPGGRTVVYVLNGSNKKRKPEALMGRFRALHAPTG